MAAGAVGLIVVALLCPPELLAGVQAWAEGMDEAFVRIAEYVDGDGASEPRPVTDVWDDGEAVPVSEGMPPPPIPVDAGNGVLAPISPDLRSPEDVAERPPTGGDADMIELPPRKATEPLPLPPAVLPYELPPRVGSEPLEPSAPSDASTRASSPVEIPDAGEVAPPPTDEGRAGADATSPPIELPPRVGPPQGVSTEDAVSSPVPAPDTSIGDMGDERPSPLASPSAVAPEPPRRVTPRTEAPAAMHPATPERLDARVQWQRARRAFWEGRFDESVAAYRALIAADPENWSAHGELGNVLYRQGEWDAAVEAFHDAALSLWQSGRQEDAWHLARIIGNLQPGRDQDLTRIFSTGGRDAPEYPSHSRLAKPTESQ